MAKKRGQDKKGLELSINVIIILVIVVIALIAIVAFFGGQFGGLSSSIQKIFTGSQAGVPQSLALQNCETACAALESAGERAVAIKDTSAFCRKYEDVDTNGDGTADTRYFCNQDAENNFASQDLPEELDVQNFGIRCEAGGVPITCEPI